MSDNTNNVTENAVTGQAGEESMNITAEYLLCRIEKIADDTEYLKNALAAMKDSFPYISESEAGAPAAAQGIAKMVASREETNRQILKLYEKMYDDLTGKRQDNKLMIFSDTIAAISEEEDSDIKLEMFNTLFGKLDYLM